MDCIKPFDFAPGVLSVYTRAMHGRTSSSWVIRHNPFGACLLTLCTLIPAFAADHPPKPGAVSSLVSAGKVSLSDACLTAGDQRQFTGKFVEERLGVWRRRLNLEDWKISLLMTRRGDLKLKTLGGIRWDKTKKTAVIWLLDPSDYLLPFDEMLDDMQLTIVHELIHLELASLPRSEASRGSEEHAVNRIAEALLKLDRQQ